MMFGSTVKWFCHHKLSETVRLCFTLPGAVGRFIRRRPSQQQLRARSEDTETSKSKLPRSRSERVLSTKKRGQRDCEEDGFSVQELAASFSK